MIQNEIENISSPEILAEIKNVLSRSEIVRRTDEGARQFVLETYAHISIFVDPTVHIPPLQQDPDDTKFIEAALAGSAHFIVSGDLHLLQIQQYERIQICSPRQFMEWIQAAK